MPFRASGLLSLDGCKPRGFLVDMGFMMIYGYARVSTTDQNTGFQITALRAAGCTTIFEEKRSAIKERPQLELLLDVIAEGDTVVIYKLDRLARSLIHLLSILERLRDRGAQLRSLTEPINPDTAAGRMFLQVLGSVAEFERSLIRERCMAGQLEALRKGKAIGRPYKLSLSERNEVVQLVDSGIPSRDIAHAYNVAKTTVLRLSYEAKGKQQRNFGAIRALL